MPASTPGLSPRIDKHRELSKAFARIGNEDLQALLGERAAVRGWGVSRAVEFEGHPVFVKRVPVTDLEMQQNLSTRNHYGLPLYYQYGVGSAGFGVFREIEAHIRTTEWVLEGTLEGVPLMHHWRIIPLPEPWSPIDQARHDNYVRYWNGNEAIGRYMLDRATAGHEAVIVLEHVPHTMAQWLNDNQDRVDDVVSQLFRTITFLRRNGIVHFDAHFSNVVSDGMRHHLTDYGLLLDERFELSDEERAFLEHHADYDYGEVLYSVGAQLLWLFSRLPEDERSSIRRALEIDDSTQPQDLGRTFVARVEDLAGLMPIGPALLAAVVRYRPVILFVDEFFAAMRANPRKDTPFGQGTLRRLLLDAGVELDV